MLAGVWLAGLESCHQSLTCLLGGMNSVTGVWSQLGNVTIVRWWWNSSKIKHNISIHQGKDVYIQPRDFVKCSLKQGCYWRKRTVVKQKLSLPRVHCWETKLKFDVTDWNVVESGGSHCTRLFERFLKREVGFGRERPADRWIFRWPHRDHITFMSDGYRSSTGEGHRTSQPIKLSILDGSATIWF